MPRRIPYLRGYAKTEGITAQPSNAGNAPLVGTRQNVNERSNASGHKKRGAPSGPSICSTPSSGFGAAKPAHPGIRDSRLVGCTPSASTGTHT